MRGKTARSAAGDRQGESRALDLMREKKRWQVEFYEDLPPTPTGERKYPNGADRARPKMTEAQEAARNRVSTRVIARANPPPAWAR